MPAALDREEAPGKIHKAIVALEERLAFLQERIALDDSHGAQGGYKRREAYALERVALPLMRAERDRRAAIWRQHHPKRERQAWEAE